MHNSQTPDERVRKPTDDMFIFEKIDVFQILTVRLIAMVLKQVQNSQTNSPARLSTRFIGAVLYL